MDITEIIANLAIGVGSNSIYTVAGKLFGRNLNRDSDYANISIPDLNGEHLATITNTQAETLQRIFNEAPISELSMLFIMSRMLPDVVTAESFKIENDIYECIRSRDLGDLEIEVALGYWRSVTAAVQETVNSKKIKHYISGLIDAPEINTALDENLAASVKALEASIPKLRQYLNDPIRTERVRSVSTELRELAAENYQRPSIDHILEHSNHTFSQLYIDRVLSIGSTRGTTSAEVFDSNRVVHAVVTGDPGGGKSTLMRHLLIKKAADPDCREVPILVKLRDVSHKDSLIVDSVRVAVERESQVPGITVDYVQDLILSGRAFIIFDGLDEIPAVGDRRNVVQKISRFAVSNQLASIVITSRRIGYGDAPFDKTKFEHYKLLPYSRCEIEEYSERWFGCDYASLKNAFLNEVKEVSDIASNPLMLSLLCSLYKNRGTIPRERRSIYSNCADLLFKRWDATRQIYMAPGTHVDHGDYLMQELAWLFYRFPSAQAGVSDTQLRDQIINYLVDNTATFRSVATRQAIEFLEFCSGRAWLLARIGTSPHGESLYEFVHHTFLEYFVAEFVARENWSNDRLANFIIEEYVTNSSSVVIDLLISSLNASNRTIVSRLLESIDRESVDYRSLVGSTVVSLKIRMISSVTTSSAIIDKVLSEALNCLDLSNSGRSVFSALLNLPPNLSDRLAGLLCDSSEVVYDSLNVATSDLRVTFVELFNYNLDFVPEFDCDDLWMSRVEVISGMISASERKGSRALRRLEYERGDSSYLLEDDIALIVPLYRGAVTVVGPVLRAIGAYARSSKLNDVDNEVLSRFESRFSPVKISTLHVDLVEDEFWSVLDEIFESDRVPLIGSVRNLVGCLVLIACEIDFDRLCDIPNLRRSVGIDPIELNAQRDSSNGSSLTSSGWGESVDDSGDDWFDLDSPLDYVGEPSANPGVAPAESNTNQCLAGALVSFEELCDLWAGSHITLVGP